MRTSETPFPSLNYRFKKYHFIDAHKGATPFVIVALMTLYGSWENPTAWLYLSTHGIYAALWVTKSRLFADKQFDAACGLGFAALAWAGLSLYWITPWIITAKHVETPPALSGLAVALFGIGVFRHFAADMQKHTHLKLAPGKLFTDGLWAHCRNPNYFGELLIYSGFSLLGMHWAPFAALALMIVAHWLPNMHRKDRSLARYTNFAAWKKQSKLFIPYIY